MTMEKAQSRVRTVRRAVGEEMAREVDSVVVAAGEVSVEEQEEVVVVVKTARKTLTISAISPTKSTVFELLYHLYYLQHFLCMPGVLGFWGFGVLGLGFRV